MFFKEIIKLILEKEHSSLQGIQKKIINNKALIN
jgi:hypothetical protein